MDFEAFTPRHWILLVLILLFFNILCYGCVLLLFGARS